MSEHLEEESSGPFLTGCTVTLSLDLGFHRRTIDLRGVTFTHVDRDSREVVEASYPDTWHYGYGRTPEAAALDLLAGMIDAREDLVGP